MLKFQEMLDSSHLSGANAAYLEAQYEAYRQDPDAVSKQWQQYFSSLGQDLAGEANHSEIRQALIARAMQPKVAMAGSVAASSAIDSMLIRTHLLFDQSIHHSLSFNAQSTNAFCCLACNAG